VLHHQMYLYEDKTGNDVNETLYNVSKSLHLLIGLLYMRINSNLTVVFVMLSLY
jgi:23S rRNA maturation mini-RNase III